MPERRHIRVSRSLEGGGERPARGYGESEAGARSTMGKSSERAWAFARASSRQIDHGGDAAAEFGNAFGLGVAAGEDREHGSA